MYEHFGFGELKSTTVTLQLADKSIKIPHGMIKDVLVKIDEFYFSVDFLSLTWNFVAILDGFPSF